MTHLSFSGAEVFMTLNAGTTQTQEEIKEQELDLLRL